MRVGFEKHDFIHCKRYAIGSLGYNSDMETMMPFCSRAVGVDFEGEDVMTEFSTQRE